jgi:hypothetical protein
VRRIALGLLLVAAVAAFGLPAAAQDWPARPVRIIVPLAPGGGGDVFARLLGEELAKASANRLRWRIGRAALNIGMRARGIGAGRLPLPDLERADRHNSSTRFRSTPRPISRERCCRQPDCAVTNK